MILYLSKMILITALLHGYYWAFLRNAPFHPYKRWYLLGSVLSSILLPFLRIPFPAGWVPLHSYSGVFTTVAASENGGAAGPAIFSTGAVHGHFYRLLYGGMGIGLLYGLVVVLFIVRLCLSLYHLWQLSRKYISVRRGMFMPNGWSGSRQWLRPQSLIPFFIHT